MDEYIFDKRMLYTDVSEFFHKKDVIKKLLFTKSTKEQYIYKLYVYSRPFISETWKDYMWDYLQGDINLCDISYYYHFYSQKRHK